MKGLVLKTDAALEPVTLADAKIYLRIDTADTNDDTLVTALIVAARKFCENYTNRAFISQTWDYWLDGFPGGQTSPGNWWDGTREGAISSLVAANGVIRLPKPPLIAVTAINWFDNSDVSNATDLSTLVIQAEAEPAAIFPKIGQIYPSSVRPRQGVQITFTCGYGTTAASVPADIVVAIKLLLAHWYENRAVSVESRLTDIPFSVSAILNPYRHLRLS